MNRKRRTPAPGCGSDLSRTPSTVTGYGPLPCEVTGPHEVHERWSAPMSARWTDLPGGGRAIEFMRSVTGSP